MSKKRHELARLMSITHLYCLWENHLHKLEEEKKGSRNPLTDQELLIEIACKKLAFLQIQDQQNLPQLLAVLVSAFPLPLPELIQSLRYEKKDIICNVHHLEMQLLARIPLHKRLMTNLWLMLTSQPESMIIRELFLIVRNQQNNTNTLNIINIIQAIVFQSLSTYYSLKIFSPTAFLASRFLLTTFDPLNPLARKLDRLLVEKVHPIAQSVTRYLPDFIQMRSDWFIRQLRTDEISLLNNEATIIWSLSILLQLALCDSNEFFPNITGIFGAILCEKLAQKLTSWMGHLFQLQSNSMSIISSATHLIASFAGFQLGYYFSKPSYPPPAPTPPENSMTRSEALTMFGCNKTATSQQIKRQHRQIALKYHPDRCGPNPTCHDKMILLNQARNILLQ